jgi:hypothetical protein
LPAAVAHLSFDSKSEDIINFRAPVLLIMPELQEFCGELALLYR